MAQKLSMDRATRERYWRERIECWRQSGQSQTEFCQSQGISMTALSHWKCEFARREQAQAVLSSPAPAVRIEEPQGSDLGWQEVPWPGEVAARPRSCIEEAQRLELVLPGGWSIRMGAQFEEESLRRLLGVLGGRPC
jgi:hypothetical protein